MHLFFKELKKPKGLVWAEISLSTRNIIPYKTKQCFGTLMRRYQTFCKMDQVIEMRASIASFYGPEGMHVLSDIIPPANT